MLLLLPNPFPPTIPIFHLEEYIQLFCSITIGVRIKQEVLVSTTISSATTRMPHFHESIPIKPPLHLLKAEGFEHIQNIFFPSL